MEEKNLTGYPSIDKPWLKYYSEEAINAKLPECSMYDYMKSCNDGLATQTSLNYFGREISYKIMLERIDTCAKALTAQGVKRGDVVSLCLLAMPEAVYLLYAINKIGAISNFLVLSGTDEVLRKQLNDSGSRIVFTVDLFSDKVVAAIKETAVEKIVEIPLYQSMPAALSFLCRIRSGARKKRFIPWSSLIGNGTGAVLPEPKVSPAETAVIMYTGGTTGEPKGVELSNLAVNTVALNYMNMSALMNFSPGQKYLDIIPPFLAYGLVFGMHMPLCLRLKEILSPDGAYASFPKLLLKYKPQHFAGGPLHIEHLMKNPPAQRSDLSFLITSAVGGDSISAEWERRASAFLTEHGAKYALQKGYGLTETAGAFCTTSHSIPHMIPFVKNNIKIIDADTRNECGYMHEGEVYLSGPSLMSGYYKNVAATGESIEEVNGVRWLRTGDLGYVTEEGYLVISGRIKRILFALGTDNLVYRIYPMAIEKALCTHPAIEKCAVVGVQNGDKGYLTVAYVVLNKGEKISVEHELRELCARSLPETSQPCCYRFVDTLPVTPIGKVNFRALEKEAEQMRLETKE